MRRILILGGGGFLGSHMAQRFQSTGWEVSATSRSGGGINSVNFDLRVKGSLSRILEKGGHSVVINAIGNTSEVSSRGLSDIDRQLLFHQFLDSNLALNGGVAIVHIGSCAEYGAAPRPYVESSLPLPTSTYGQGKLEESKFFLQLAKKGAKLVIVRPSIVFGPGQKGDMLVPSILSSLLSGRLVPLREPNSIRDFLYIDDFSKAIERLVKSSFFPGEIYNLGSGESVRVYEFVERLASELKIDLGANWGQEWANRNSGLEHLEVDTSKIFRDLGWKANMSYSDGIRDMASRI